MEEKELHRRKGGIASEARENQERAVFQARQSKCFKKWSTVLNAADMSSKIRTEKRLLDLAIWRSSSMTLTRIASVP